MQEKKVLSNLGECKVKFLRKKNKLLIPVIIFSVLIIALQFLRSFPFYIAVVLDLVAILACFIAIKDFIYQKNAGLYLNGLISDGRFIKKSDILALPTLDYEESEEFRSQKDNDEYSSQAYETAMKSLKIVSDSHGEFYVGFSTAEERKNAVEIMRTWV